MIFIESLATGFICNLSYDKCKNFAQKFSNVDDIFNESIKQLTNKHDKLEPQHIVSFLESTNVEKEISNYFENFEQEISFKILTSEFLCLFDDAYFTEKDAQLILNDFFEILDSKIKKDPELRQYLMLHVQEKTLSGVKETSANVKEMSNDLKAIKSIFIPNEEKKLSLEQLDANYESEINPYLDKILNEYKIANLNELYTELSVLEIPAKNMFPLAFKANDDKNRPKEFEISELAKNESKLIISGNSGFGKTTTLQWLTYVCANKCLKDMNYYIPIYVELNSYTEGDFLDYLFLITNRKGLSEKAVIALLTKGNVMFLIDGLDLVSETEVFDPYTKISKFIGIFNSCGYVISSRPGFFDRLDKYEFKICEIEELNENKISSFIDRYVDNEKIANVIKNEILKKEKLSIFTNPLMLFIAINVASSRLDEETILPSTSTELYNYFIENLFTHYKEKRKGLKSDKTQIETVATHLYFTLQSHNKVRCKWEHAVKLAEEKSKVDGFRNVLGVEVLEDLLNLGILKKDGDYIKYGIHQSFQEYFAAIKLKGLFQNGVDVSPAFIHPKWENAVIFASEMFKNSDDFFKAILVENEFELASKCSKNITEKARTDFCNLLYENRNSKYSLERIIAVKSLGRLNDISHLIDFAKDKNFRVREIVAESLGEVNSDEAIKTLCILIEDESEQVMENALFSLSKMGSRKAIESLFNAFKLEDSEITETTIDVLNNIIDKIDFDLIIEGLTDENDNLRISCMFLIELNCFPPNKECEKLVELLIEALSDENYDVRVSATKVLIDIGTTKAVEAINNLLICGSNEIRKSIIDSINDYEILDRINLDTAMEKLIEILKTETSCEIRVETARILGLMGSDKVKKTLFDVLKYECISVKKTVLNYLPFELNENFAVVIDMLKDEDIELKIEAVKCLGKVKSKAATEPLKKLLDDKCPEIRENVILALGKIYPEYIFEEDIKKLDNDNSAVKMAIIKVTGNFDSERSANQLIESLKDNDPIVRSCAKSFLLKMTFNELDELLIKSLQNENVHLKCSAADILGERNSKMAIRPLINSLEDKEDSVKIAAAKALGWIKSEEAVNRLIKLLYDVNSEVKIASIKALGNIKSEKAIEPLIEKLTDSSFHVVKNTIYTLGEIKNEKAGNALLSLFSENNSIFKNELVWSFGKMDFSEAFKPIIIALEQDNSIYVNSYFVLKKLGTVTHKEVLESFLESKNPLVADICFEILHEITKNEMMEKALFPDIH